jgi:hypothetical protein
MKTFFCNKRNCGLTMIEVLMVLAVLMVVAALLLPAMVRPHRQYGGIQCVNNLKQIGLAARIWAGDNNDKYPMEVAVTQGGGMELISGPYAFRHFQVMSNELSTPKVLFCPNETDRNRLVATNFTDFNNSNISYFVGVDATETNVQMLLSGDHNISNGTLVKNGLLELTTNKPSEWTTEMHNKVGNVVLADGTVQQLSMSGLQNAVANTGFATNRLQMP